KYNDVPRDKLNGSYIYDSNNRKKNKRKLMRIAKKRYEMSDDVDQTGIVPNIYNQVKFYEKEHQEAIKRGKEERETLKKAFGIEFFDNDSNFSDNSTISNISKDLDWVNQTPQYMNQFN